MPLIGIYGLKCKTTGKWYVGQGAGKNGIEGRWDDYRLLRKCKAQIKLYRALLKYGYDDFDKVIIEECDLIDWILDYREMYWIRKLDSLHNGYNCTEGGKGFLGGKHRPETIEKMRKSAKGRKRGPMSEEQKEKLRKVLKGRVCGSHGPRSEETKRKMKTAHAYLIGTHFHHTEEAKRKISEASKRQVRQPLSYITKQKIGAAVRQAAVMRHRQEVSQTTEIIS